MRRLDLVLILIVLALGLVHIAFTPVFHKTFSLQALWFAGTGLALCFLGVLHILRRSSTSRLALLLACTASAVTTLFTILVAYKLSAPQAYLSVVANALLTITSALDLRTRTQRAS